ncbi:uncharacterized protein LOC136088087 [Hydra vulgaris]|uniref:Uncharacterized protein LOC136088087 n=1 Tax=Hydra vulgaris TaxID=6087 RepID=A0ABM4D0P4_HYDVU
MASFLWTLNSHLPLLLFIIVISRKFRKNEFKNKQKIKNGNLTSHTKNAVLNLCDTKIPNNQNDLLKLGPNFVPSLKHIPYMDIIATTELFALKLEYNNKIENAQDLRKNALKELKMGKKISQNLTREQRKALKEIKENKLVKIYPFVKGNGFVRIEHEKALERIRDQIGQTKVSSEDPIFSYALKIKISHNLIKNKDFQK